MVYVDPLMATKPSKKWPYRQACHLRADSEEELHKFAQRLGLQRSWFQGHHRNPRFHHYDITASMRAKAIAMGARALDRQESAAQLMGTLQTNNPTK